MTYYDLRKDEVEPTWYRESPWFYYFEGFSFHAMYSSRGYVEMLYQKFCFLSMLAFSTTLSHVYWKRTVMTVPEALQSFEGTSTIRQSYRPLDMYVKYIMYIYIYTHLAGVQNRKLHLHGNVSMNLSSTLFGTTKSWYWNGGGFLVEMIGIWESVLKMACTLHLSFSKDLDVTPVPEAPFHAERILHWPSPHQRRVVVLPWEVLCHRILSHCLTCTSEWKNESFWESLSKWCFQQFSKVITYLLGCPPSQ